VRRKKGTNLCAKLFYLVPERRRKRNRLHGKVFGAIEALIMHSIFVYDPTAEEDKSQSKLAARLPSLDGKVIGLLDNTKDLVGVLLDEVRQQLQKDFPQARFRNFRKESVSGIKPDLLEQALTCDAIVGAVGD
jgi:hypothetical protein